MCRAFGPVKTICISACEDDLHHLWETFSSAGLQRVMKKSQWRRDKKARGSSPFIYVLLTAG